MMTTFPASLEKADSSIGMDVMFFGLMINRSEVSPLFT